MHRNRKTDDSIAALSPEDRAEVLARREAFAFLYEGLREAKRRFEAGQDAGRDGAVHALEKVIEFLERFEPMRTEGLQAPLAVVFDALIHLDDGEVAPLLRPIRLPRGGRGRASAMHESLKGTVAFTVKRLHATGLAMPAAHRNVARELRKAGVTAARGPIRKASDRTVSGWCEDVAADYGCRGEAAQTLKGLESVIPPPVVDGVAAAEIQDIQKAYLALLAELIHKLRLGKKPLSPQVNCAKSAASSS